MRSQIIRPRESLALYKSFNLLFDIKYFQTKGELQYVEDKKHDRRSKGSLLKMSSLLCLRQASMGVSPEGLMQKLEEEVKKQINVVFTLSGRRAWE